jgi:alcohol dehydrogenase class IV
MENLNVSFHTPTQIIFGEGVSKQIGEELKQRGHKKILVVTDKGIEACGILSKCLDDLVKNELKPEILYVVENPTVENVHAGREIVLEKGIDAVIAIGGGSPIDAAKAISMLSAHSGSIVDYEYGLTPITMQGPAIYTVPTTSGTGSEVTFWSVITNKETHRKFDVGSPLMAAEAAFIDPELTYSLPGHLTAATGMDALCHAIEVYTTKGASILTNTLAIRAIELISQNLVEANKNGDNKTARCKVMLGSTIAGMAFPNAGLGAVHGLTAPLGGFFDVPHGMANAIMLPIVMEFNQEAAKDAYIEIGRAFGLKNSTVAATINHVIKMNEIMGIPSLSSFNVDCNMVEELAESALGKNSNCDSNLRKVTKEDAILMYNKALVD